MHTDWVFHLGPEAIVVPCNQLGFDAETLAAARAVAASGGGDRGKILRLRGEYLSQIAEVEGNVNHLITTSFGVADERRQEFILGVLVRLRMAERPSNARRSTSANYGRYP